MIFVEKAICPNLDKIGFQNFIPILEVILAAKDNYSHYVVKSHCEGIVGRGLPVLRDRFRSTIVVVAHYFLRDRLVAA